MAHVNKLILLRITIRLVLKRPWKLFRKPPAEGMKTLYWREICSQKWLIGKWLGFSHGWTFLIENVCFCEIENTSISHILKPHHWGLLAHERNSIVKLFLLRRKCKHLFHVLKPLMAPIMFKHWFNWIKERTTAHSLWH